MEIHLFSQLWRNNHSPHNLGKREAKSFQLKENTVAKFNDVTVGQMEASINRMGGMENFLRYIGGAGKIVFETLLTIIRSVQIDSIPASTVSKQLLSEAGVVWTSDDFKTQFMGLNVAPVQASTLTVSKLEKALVDGPILTELGDKAEMSITQVLEFMNKNRKREGRFLAYARGLDGELWAVRFAWDSANGGWHVFAYSVTSSGGWGVGRQVVSRK